MLTDYSFYTTDFCGTLIPSCEEYASAAIKAEAYVLSLTDGKTRFITPNGEILFENKARMAVCAVAECFYKEMKSGKASESLDNHSVSYFQKNNEDFERERYKAAVMFLKNTGLLNMGVLR